MNSRNGKQAQSGELIMRKRSLSYTYTLYTEAIHKDRVFCARGSVFSGLLVGAILHVLYAGQDKTLRGIANFLSAPLRF